MVRKLFVGGEEQLERRAILDLPRQRARRPKHELDRSAAIARECLGDLVQREVQIRRGGDRRRLLRRRRRGEREPEERSTASESERSDARVDRVLLTNLPQNQHSTYRISDWIGSR